MFSAWLKFFDMALGLLNTTGFFPLCTAREDGNLVTEDETNFLPFVILLLPRD